MAKGERVSASRRRAKGRGKPAPIRRAPKKLASAKKNDAVLQRVDVGSEPRTKTEACLVLLTRAEGASLAELQQVTRWQAHSVRGFLAGTVKKIPGASLISEKREGERRYFLRRATAAQKSHHESGGRS